MVEYGSSPTSVYHVIGSCGISIPSSAISDSAPSLALLRVMKILYRYRLVYFLENNRFRYVSHQQANVSCPEVLPWPPGQRLWQVLSLMGQPPTVYVVSLHGTRALSGHFCMPYVCGLV